MAKEFQGRARGKGFSPVTFNNAAETRLRQQTEQQLTQMRAFRDSDIENRKRILSDMKENSQYRAKEQERDKGIITQNLSQQQRQVELDQNERTRRFKQGIDSDAQIFNDVAEFSKTASKIATDLYQTKIDADWDNAVAAREALGPGAESQIIWDAGVVAEGVAEAELNASIDLAEVQGADPYQAEKARHSSKFGSMAWARTSARMTAETSWASFREAGLANSEQEVTVGDRTFKVNEASDVAEKAAAIQVLRKQFFAQAGWTGQNVNMLGDAIDYINKSNVGYLEQEARLEITKSKNQQAQQALSSFTSGPLDPVNAGNAWNDILRSVNWDAERAWGKIQKGIEQGIIPIENVANIPMPDGNLLRDHPRFNYLRQIELKRQQDLQTMEENSKKQLKTRMEEEWKNRLKDENATAGDLATAAEAFRDNNMSVPDWLQKRITNSDPSGSAMMDAFKQNMNNKVAQGILTQKDVDEAYERDPVFGRQLQEKYEKQNPFSSDETYKEMAKSIEGLTKQDGSTTTPSSASAAIVLEQEFKQRVESYTLGGMSIPDASRKAATELLKEVAAAEGVSTAKYFRQYNKITRTYDFPNIQPTNPSQAAATRGKVISDALQSGDSSQVRTLLTTKDSIYNDTEAARIKQTYDNSPAAFTFPAEVMIIADKTGKSPMEVLNTILSTQGVDPIPPPPSMQLLDAASPAAKALLQQHRSAYRSIRGLTRTANENGVWNSAAVPIQYVPMIQSAATTYSVPESEVSAIIDIEALNWDPNSESPTGAKGLMQIFPSAHPQFFQENDWRDPQANINYGTQYYAGLKQRYGGDSVAAAMAYNAGPGNYDKYLKGELPDGPVKREMVEYGRRFAKALLKYQGASSGMLTNPMTIRQSPGARSFTGALTYNANKQAYRDSGNFLQDELGFKVAEHSDFGGVSAGVHEPSGYHPQNEAFDVTHWRGTRLNSIEKTRVLKEAIRKLGLFEEIIGPGDGDPAHESHLHLGGLMRPLTPEDKQTLAVLFQS